MSLGMTFHVRLIRDIPIRKGPLLAQSGRWPNSYDSFSNFCRDLPKAFLACWHGVKDMGSSNLRIDEQLKARLDGT